MRTKRSLQKSIPFSRPGDSLFWKEPARQALALFIFSAFFAVLFNAFYADGIELKYKPLIPKGFRPGLSMAPSSVVNTSSSQKISKRNPTPVSTPTDNIPRVSLFGAKQRFDAKNCVFLDARKPEEFAEGHIPGSLNFYGNELDDYAQKVLPQLPDKTKEIIVYCHGGDCDLSLLVARVLSQNGYEKVKVFVGGWPEWKKAGYPVNTGEAP